MLDKFISLLNDNTPLSSPWGRIVVIVAVFALAWLVARTTAWTAGRILTWHEGHSYSFSDLSLRGAQVGFPHVYEYRVISLGIDCSRLTVTVRGRWTATWIPLPARRSWLAFVMAQTRAILRVHLVRLCRYRRMNAKRAAGHAR